MNVDDLLHVLHYHWVRSNDYFHTERDRVQLALLCLLMAYSSARPGTLTECAGYRGSNSALRYRDIELFVVSDPSGSKVTCLLIKVRLRLMKGRRDAGVP